MQAEKGREFSHLSGTDPTAAVAFLQPRLRGLYAITPTSLRGQALIEATREVLAGGARLLQYRDKSDCAHERLSTARALAELCREAGALFLVNDDVELALASAADGAHLGEGDGALSAARQRLGPTAILGASCYDSIALAETARDQGADYVAFGAFFPSASKQTRRRADRAQLQWARDARLPCVAIGGVTPDNAPPLLAAGANMLAVIEAVWSSADRRAAAARFAALF